MTVVLLDAAAAPANDAENLGGAELISASDRKPAGK